MRAKRDRHEWISLPDSRNIPTKERNWSSSGSQSMAREKEWRRCLFERFFPGERGEEEENKGDSAKSREFFCGQSFVCNCVMGCFVGVNKSGTQNEKEIWMELLIAI